MCLCWISLFSIFIPINIIYCSSEDGYAVDKNALIFKNSKNSLKITKNIPQTTVPREESNTFITQFDNVRPMTLLESQFLSN